MIVASSEIPWPPEIKHVAMAPPSSVLSGRLLSPAYIGQTSGQGNMGVEWCWPEPSA